MADVTPCEYSFKLHCVIPAIFDVHFNYLGDVFELL